MRAIVAGQMQQDDFGCLALMVWFRVAIPADNDPVNPRPGRQAQYAKDQASYTPQAPGDYVNLFSAEITAFRAGQYREMPPISFNIDPNWTGAQIESILVDLSNDRFNKLLAYDDARFKYNGTNYSGGTWNVSGT